MIRLFRHLRPSALAELLRNAGADVTIRYFQAGHELTREMLKPRGIG